MKSPLQEIAEQAIASLYKAQSQIADLKRQLSKTAKLDQQLVEEAVTGLISYGKVVQQNSGVVKKAMLQDPNQALRYVIDLVTAKPYTKKASVQQSDCLSVGNLVSADRIQRQQQEYKTDSRQALLDVLRK